jgi:hypothetical protein
MWKRRRTKMLRTTDFHKKVDSRFVFALLSLLFCVFAMADDTKTAPSCGCQMNFLYNKSGWTIPGLEGSIAAYPRASYVTNNTKSQMFVTRMKPGRQRATVTRLHCSERFGGAVEVQSLDVEVLELWAFDVEGKVFAYAVTAGWLGSPDVSGHRVQIGTVSDILFSDMDGSGKFVLMKFTSTPFAPQIPDWIKRANP